MMTWLLLGLLVFQTDGIEKSVGKKGANRAADVRKIQNILNQIPNAVGGPRKKLTANGIADANLERSIGRFQRIQLGFEDELVEPGKRTERRLREFAGFEFQDRGKPELVWGALVTAKFKKRLLGVCQELEMKPDHLMAAIAFETAGTFSPSIKNAAGSGATGLIQFMPSTAKGLGTTTERLSKMTSVQQLDYVEKYFRPYKSRCKTLSDVYMAILWPAAIGKPESFVLFDQQTKPKTYQLNRGLDWNRDGRITKEEAARHVKLRLKKGEAFRG